MKFDQQGQQEFTLSLGRFHPGRIPTVAMAVNVSLVCAPVLRAIGLGRIQLDFVRDDPTPRAYATPSRSPHRNVLTFRQLMRHAQDVRLRLDRHLDLPWTDPELGRE